jgi:hypothetical protein
MVPKPGQPGQWRLCVDYRALNQKLVRDNFPLPHPTDVFNELAGHRFYSRLDLASGFWQIRLHEADGAANRGGGGTEHDSAVTVGEMLD